MRGSSLVYNYPLWFNIYSKMLAMFNCNYLALISINGFLRCFSCTINKDSYFILKRVSYNTCVLYWFLFISFYLYALSLDLDAPPASILRSIHVECSSKKYKSFFLHWRLFISQSLNAFFTTKFKISLKKITN